MAFPVLLDTCVLLPISVADLFLRLAEAKRFRVLWSEGILEELERNLLAKIGLRPEAAARRLHVMREFFPDAIVENHEELIETMRCDEKDRHVLAAAVRANAEVIVTFNLKDFPLASTAPYDIEAVSPDEFLLDQLDLFPAVVLRCVTEQAAAYQDPRIDVDELLAQLAKCGLEKFAGQIGERLSRGH
ncbi:PIN domain-containing protein [Arthrobacter rhombi]|uniref:PIN domain-containing protein n=1 Tax=Arthrobacter rhombi TaxID=71253 RepID=UPI003FD494D3